MTKRYGVEVTGVCRICGAEGYTEMHHIISQARCKKIGKEDWITNNSGNIVELCRSCHDHTTASMFRSMRENEEWIATSHTRSNEIIKDGGDNPEQCWAMLKSGRRRCSKKARFDGLCVDHHKSIRQGLPPHKKRRK